MGMMFFIIEPIMKLPIAFMKKTIKLPLLLWQEQERIFIMN